MASRCVSTTNLIYLAFHSFCATQYLQFKNCCWNFVNFSLAHFNAKPYFDWYFKNVRVEAHPKVHQTFKVELNGNCEALAKVLQMQDKILAEIHFEEENRFEWIYLGSPRIFAVCRALIIQKVYKNILQCKLVITTEGVKIQYLDVIVNRSFIERKSIWN